MNTATIAPPAGGSRTGGILARTRDVARRAGSRIHRPSPAGPAPAASVPESASSGGSHGADRLVVDTSGPRSWRARERVSVAALLLGTLAFWLYGLSANGYANSFYSAAVQAGSQSWEAFFYGSSDAANSITVDKPPASLWVMALSVRLFGLSSWAILVPEVLMGVATVGVLYASVRRHAGHAAGLIAGLVLAVTPVATLMFRFNNPDALLALLLTAAAAATLRALEHARVRWFVLVGVLLGFGFLTKTLQAFLVVPVFGLVYLFAAPTTLGKRLAHLVAGLAAMVLAGGWWVAVVELVPASMRPYIGGSQTNSFLELTFGYNGLGRINGDEAGSVGPNMGTAGVWRMFSSSVGGQISWLIPSALILLVAGVWVTRRLPRTDLTRAAYLVWGGAMVVTGLVFSLMAGIFHEYYTVALAPYVAAVVGIGAVEGWRRSRAADRTRWGSLALAAATAAASTWGFVLLTRVDAHGPLRYVVLAAGMAAALLLLVTRRVHVKAVPVIAAVALAASLAGPTAYSVSTVTSAHTGSIVTAGPSSGMGGPGGQGAPGGGTPPAMPGRSASAAVGSNAEANTTTTRTSQASGMSGLLNASTPNTQVVAALQENASQYTWVAAAIGSQNSAGLQLGSGEPVMAVGGFNGSDPSPTLAQFQQYAQSGQIHYFLAGGGFGAGSGSSTATQISEWVVANYTAVTIGGTTFYDLTQPLSGN